MYVLNFTTMLWYGNATILYMRSLKNSNAAKRGIPHLGHVVFASLHNVSKKVLKLKLLLNSELS